MFFRLIKYCVLFMVVALQAGAINSPQTRCVNVLSNGQVLLTWQNPADPNNEFKKYTVYASNTGGPGSYANVGTVNAYATNFYQVACNANLQSWYFYVTTTNTLNIESAPVDTVQSMLLIMNSPANASVANFQWNDIHFPTLPGESAAYTIYKEYPQNNWTAIGTKAVNYNTHANYTYNDIISVCYDSINYRVELYDPVLGCTSVSNVKGEWFRDKTAPVLPVLDSVSVNASGQAILSISPSTSPDTKCFVVYLFTGSNNLPIDTICNNNTTAIFTYTVALNNANSGSVAFSVAAIDSCKNISLIDSAQHTIFLKGKYHVCAQKSSLNWNSYKYMQGGVNYYEILCSVNGGPFAHLGDTSATIYFQKGIQAGSTYCYLVRAHSNLHKTNGQDSVTSTSNKFCLTPGSVNHPGYIYQDNVTVIHPSEKMEVDWAIDKTVKVGGFTIYRSLNYNGPFSHAGYVSANGSGIYSFIDNAVDVNAHNYYYYEEVFDTCNLPIIHSDTSNSILLHGVPGTGLTATLNWNNYGKWLGNVSGYNIYRSLDGSFTGVPVANVPGGTTTYTDDLSNLTAHEGKFTYYVEAVEGPGDVYGFTSKSLSNYVDIYVDAQMYIPNAFFPKGHNKVFLPIGDFIDKTDYRLSILNRWVEKIFETTNPTEGWDGGNWDEGLYVYLVQYKTSIGEYREQKGTVTLVK